MEQKEAPDPSKVKLLAAACLPCVPDNISTCLTAGISSWQVAVYIAGLRNARNNPFAFSLCNKVPFLCPVPELESYPLQNESTECAYSKQSIRVVHLHRPHSPVRKGTGPGLCL